MSSNVTLRLMDVTTTAVMFLIFYDGIAEVEQQNSSVIVFMLLYTAKYSWWFL